MDCIKLDALGLEDLQQQRLRPIKVGLREIVGAQPVLVADHHKPKSGVFEFTQSRDHALDQTKLLETVDLLIGRLFNERAVAVDKQYLLKPHVQAPCFVVSVRSRLNTPAARWFLIHCPP